MDQPATELLLLSLPCQDVPVEQMFIIKTHCHKLLFEFLLILQAKQQILQAQGMLQPKKKSVPQARISPGANSAWSQCASLGMPWWSQALTHRSRTHRRGYPHP